MKKLRGLQIISISVSVLAMVMGGYGLFYATQPLLAQEQTEESPVCKDAMEIYIGERTKAFGDKVDGILGGKEQNSNLLNDAMIEFRSFRSDLNKKFEELYFGEKAPTFVEKLPVFTECRNVVDEAIRAAQINFMNVMTLNSEVKKTARLIGKYRDLNEKIRNLAGQFAVFKGQFDALTTRIGFWTEQCL